MPAIERESAGFHSVMTKGSPKEESSGMPESQATGDMPQPRQMLATVGVPVAEVENEEVEEPALKKESEGQAESRERVSDEQVEIVSKNSEPEESSENRAPPQLQRNGTQEEPSPSGTEQLEVRTQAEVPSELQGAELQEVPLETPKNTEITITEKPSIVTPISNGKTEVPPPTTEVKEKISCVQVLNVMVFFAFMVNYMLRVNLTIAIVDMIAINETTTTVNGTVVIQEPKFAWDTYQKNLILGCFFWGYILTELPGGRMSEVFGPRRVFGYSILIASIVTFFTPFAALRFDYIGVVVLRVIIGFMLGVTFPAMQPIASKWIPPKDRTKFVSNMMASSLGAAITLPVCGYLISSFGWQSVFYVTGVLGIVWAVAWFLFVFDSPSQHPRITREEREYLEKAIGASSTTRKAPKVPWVRMLTSLPVWAIVITHASSVFGYFTFLNQMPTYMKVVLRMEIQKNGILSSFPYVGKYAMALITSYIADYVRGSEKFTTTAIRKFFTTFAVGIPGLLMVAQVYLGYSTVWTVSIFTIALTLNGAVTAGYLGNGLDIAPNFSGTIFGIANTLSSMGGFLSTYVVADITFQNETYERFQIVFWILAVTYFAGSIIYLIFGTGELQDWNNVEEDKSRDIEIIEKQPLKNETNNEKL